MARTRRQKANSWRRQHAGDAHVRAARRDGYRARSAYKLLEIDKAARLFAAGMRVLDLGAAPGGWSQVIRRRVGGGVVVAVDLLPMQSIDGVIAIQGDFLSDEVQAQIAAAMNGAADVIVSDMAPNLSGVAVTDQARAAALGGAAVAFARRHLAAGGKLLIKTFEGEARARLQKKLGENFAAARVLRPKATRAASRELYLLAAGFKA